MSKKKFNLFATSSNSGFLKCLTVKPHEVIVGSDINSLEPHVLAHYSQDPGYLQIYRKGANPNCIYLYLGAHSPMHGNLFRSVYDPYNSTIESVAKAKKLYGVERQMYKIAVLTLAYEGTEFSLKRSFTKVGIKVSDSEIHGLIKLFRRTFKGLVNFREELKQQWKLNNGFILTGRGRPLVIPGDMVFKNRGESPILAMFCQATGHDFMTRWLWHINQYRKHHKIKTIPYICDRHDATYWKCAKDEQERVAEMIKYGYDRFNDEADLSVVLSGDIKVGKDMRIQ